MKIIFYCFLLLLICSAATCNKNPFATSVQRIYVENNGSEDAIFYVGFLYPDTSISEDPLLINVPANQKRGKDFTESSWDELFNRTPKDTLSVFIFSKDTLAKYSYPEVQSEYKILKRYDLSQQDLEAVDYTITYP